MFYSHEILTSHEGGVATVWLVATLGPGSHLKKVNRKAILDVDVPKACEIITTPEAPMALRLQSNLLYGVSRVYSQQCGYVLSDAQLAHSNMRALLKAVRTTELDPDAGKARPDQLILHDDPAFLPGFFFPDLDIDLSALDISTDDSFRRSSILSPHSQRSSVSSHDNGQGSMLGLIIPSSDTDVAAGLGGFVIPEDNRSFTYGSIAAEGFLEDMDEGFNLDPGFTVDRDGNLVLTEHEENPQVEDVVEAKDLGTGEDSLIGGLAQEAIEGTFGGAPTEVHDDFNANLGMDLQTIGNDFILPEAEAFPAANPQPPVGTVFVRSSSTVPQEEEFSQFAEAPLRRRRRVPKELPRDSTTELHNADLAYWNNNYVANMMVEDQVKLQRRASKLTKKKAQFWVYGSGIGGVGSHFDGITFKSPLNMYAGDALMQALTGITIPIAGKKRSREEESSQESDSEGRRVRSRDSDEKPGSGNVLPPIDDEAMAILAGEDIEFGREAQPALEDQSFPWNISAGLGGSRPGSVVRGHGIPSSAGGFPTSAGRPSSVSAIGGVPGSIDRRVSRIPSASPLVGHGPQRYSSLELHHPNDDDELLGGHDVSMFSAEDEFQLYGPAAGVSTQVAAESQWMRATLDQESNNFLEFVRTDIAEKVSDTDEEAQRSVLFEDLLPASQHSKIVAAQAFHHVLALATKGLIDVQQDLAYGPIALGLPSGV